MTIQKSRLIGTGRAEPWRGQVPVAAGGHRFEIHRAERHEAERTHLPAQQGHHKQFNDPSIIGNR